VEGEPREEGGEMELMTSNQSKDKQLDSAKFFHVQLRKNLDLWI
jgi:hypothetical protein